MRAYRWLLHLYPASFRNEYGAEMAGLFARRRAGVTRPAGVAWLWVTTLGEVVSNALLVHWDVSRQDLHYTARTFRRTPGFRRHGRAAGRAGRRRDDRGLLGHRLRAPPTAAVSRTEPAREDLGGHAGLFADGAVAGQLPGLEAGQHVVRPHRCLLHPRRELRRPGRTAAARTRRRLVRPLPGARRAPDPRPHVQPRRRPHGRSGNRASSVTVCGKPSSAREPG